MERTLDLYLKDVPVVPAQLRLSPQTNTAVTETTVDLGRLYHHYYMDGYEVSPPNPTCCATRANGRRSWMGRSSRTSLSWVEIMRPLSVLNLLSHNAYPLPRGVTGRNSTIFQPSISPNLGLVSSLGSAMARLPGPSSSFERSNS
jgi:hypothetical protein